MTLQEESCRSTNSLSLPEMLRAYIGCGQVVNMEKSCRTAYDYAAAHADQKALERLKHTDCTYTGENWLDDLVKPFLFSSYYSIPDLIRRQKGSLQAIKRLWPELMKTDFEGQTKYSVPIIFAEGRHDAHVSSALAKEYFDTIQTEKQFFWFEESCHFPQWSENVTFNKMMAELFS